MIKYLQCVEWDLFSLSRGGVILEDSDIVGEEEMTVLHAHPLLKGGKGGELRHTIIGRWMGTG